jgi:hypothetical protein
MKNNRLILDFMGVAPIMYGPNSYGWRDGVFFSCSHDTPEKVMDSIAVYAKYDCDWNWIMPVVQKCYDVAEEDEFVGDITHALLDVNIEELYKAIVEFIRKRNGAI